MAVIGHLHKIQIGGRLAGTESWSMGFHYLRADTGNMLIQGAMTTAVNAWFTHANTQLNAFASLDFIKANELDPAPRVNAPDPKTGLPRPASPAFTRYLTEGGTNAVFLSPGTSPAAGAILMPPQCTVAVSLTTALSRGPAHLGRVYPPSGVSITADGRVATGQPSNFAERMAILISALNAANAGRVVIYSGVRGPDTNNVLGCRCGKVVDTQRRRRRNLLEEYAFQPVT